MEEEQYYNSDSVVHKPRFIHGGGRVVILRVDGVGGADRTSVINSSLVVRLRAAALILGEQSSMLFNISEVSGASLSISLDMRSMLNNMIYLDIWGLGPHVQEAERLIFNLLRQPYNGPCVLPMSYNYIHHDSIILPIDKATHLFKYSIMKVETKTYTWIDVHASPWKLGAAQDDVELHFYGASMKNINSAVDLVKKVVSEAGEGGTTMKKEQTCGLFGKLLWIGTKDSSRCLGKGMNCVFKEFWKGAKQSSRCLAMIFRKGAKESSKMLGKGISICKKKKCLGKIFCKGAKEKKNKGVGDDVNDGCKRSFDGDLNGDGFPACVSLNDEMIVQTDQDCSSEKKDPVLIPRPLINPGTECFLIASLQALLACSPFVNLLQVLRTHTIPQTEFPTLHAFVKFLTAFDMPSGLHSKKKNDDALEIGEAFLPDMFEGVLNNFKPDIQNRFSGRTNGRHEDAQEFLLFVMNQMHAEMKKFEASENGTKGVLARLTEIFGGVVVSSVKAEGKKPSETIRDHDFLYFSLEVGSDKVVTLEDALRLYSEPATLEDYRPSSAAEADASRASKSTKVKQLPQIIVIHLLRFKYDRTQGSTKIEKPVHFPLEMVLNRQLLVTPTTKGREYELVATIRHHGTGVSTGHYTADVLHPNGKWLHCDDASVVQIDESDVLHAQAFVLFYKRQ